MRNRRPQFSSAIVASAIVVPLRKLVVRHLETDFCGPTFGDHYKLCTTGSCSTNRGCWFVGWRCCSNNLVCCSNDEEQLTAKGVFKARNVIPSMGKLISVLNNLLRLWEIILNYYNIIPRH